MEIKFSFKVHDVGTGKVIDAGQEGERMSPSYYPATSLFAVDENGLLVVLRSDGTFDYPRCGGARRVVWTGVQK